MEATAKAVRITLWFVLAFIAGIVVAGSSFPTHWPELNSIHMYWYMGRASGFIAFGLLLASVVLGLAISSRVFDGLLVRPWVFDMHQFLSLYVLIVMLFHALIMLPDPYAKFEVWRLLLGFASPYRPLVIGVGAIVLYGSVIVSLSFYVKGRIGQRGWRMLHYLTFGLFVLAMVHGIFAGTDSGTGWAQLVYLSSGLAVLFFTFFRILAARSIARRNSVNAVAPKAVTEAAPAQ
jgi:predicted ferric reductase